MKVSNDISMSCMKTYVVPNTQVHFDEDDKEFNFLAV